MSLCATVRSFSVALALCVALFLCQTLCVSALRDSSARNTPRNCARYPYTQSELQRPLEVTTTLSSSESPRRRKESLLYRNLCFFPYEMVPGYTSAQRSVDEAMAAMRSTEIWYRCDDKHTRFFLEHHLRNAVTGRVFNATTLLGLLRGRTLTLLGDSTARQVFADLQVELLPFMSTTLTDYNTTAVIHNAPIGANPHSGYLYARKRRFEAHNATLFHCQNSRLESLLTKDAQSACGESVAAADFLVIAAGPWFRPYVYMTDNLPRHADELARRLKDFTARIHAVRREIAALNPRARVVWRLVPHIGAFDELALSPDQSGIDPALRATYKTRDWDDVSLVAQWALAFNDAMRALVANDFPRDALWDVFTASSLFIDFAQRGAAPEQRHKVHADATHHCAGGAIRAALLLLEEIVGRALAAQN